MRDLIRDNESRKNKFLKLFEDINVKTTREKKRGIQI